MDAGKVKMKKYKYIHLLWHQETKFSPRIVEAINHPDNGFNRSEHLFVTTYESVYNTIKSYDNTCFVDLTPEKSAKIVNHYAQYCDYIILHSGLNWRQTLRIKDINARKIIWRTWGYDIVQERNDVDYFIRIIYKIIMLLTEKKIKKFSCIGIANTVDKVALEKVYRVLPPMKRIPYIISKESWHRNLYDNIEKKKESGKYRIMLGHSGLEEDNHIELLRRLEKYEHEDFEVIVILSYGDNQYIKVVESYIESSIIRNKIVTIKEFMGYDQFANLINSVDAAILDGKKSYALGNISLLLLYKKKIFLNEEGILAEAFNRLSLPFEGTKKIGEATIELLKESFGNYDNDCDLLPLTYSKSVQYLHEVFD